MTFTKDPLECVEDVYGKWQIARYATLFSYAMLDHFKAIQLSVKYLCAGIRERARGMRALVRMVLGCREFRGNPYKDR